MRRNWHRIRTKIFFIQQELNLICRIDLKIAPHYNNMSNMSGIGTTEVLDLLKRVG